MRRREVIRLLGATTAWPFTARAQQPAMPVIGFLSPDTAELTVNRVRAFRAGLSEAGYVEGHSVAVEYRWAQGQYDRLPTLAADLVARRVAVIVAMGPAARHAKEATTAIPIVFSTLADPVAIGLVASLSRPGGNLTGVTSLGVELGQKKLELIHELIPAATSIAVLINPTNASVATVSSHAQAAARTLGLQLHILHASTERQLESVFANVVRMRPGGLVIAGDAFFSGRSEQLAALALRHAVPAIYQYREFAAAGGLMSYGGSVTDNYRLLGIYTGRILKGEKPADLPVQQSTKVELIINLRTARALGLTVPLSLRGRADEVIE